MGREASITPEQVHATADAIRAEGGRPTLRAVRERLGSGSHSTVNRHLQRWREAHCPPPTQQASLPPALQRSILDFIATEIAAARSPLEAELAEQLQTAADLGAESERGAETLEDYAAELAALMADKAAVEGRAAQLGLDLSAAKDHATRERQAAEAARVELATALVRLESVQPLQAELLAVRAELEQQRQARVEAEQRAAVLAAQKADMEDRLADAKAELGRVASHAERAPSRIAQLADPTPCLAGGPGPATRAGRLPPRLRPSAPGDHDPTPRR